MIEINNNVIPPLPCTIHLIGIGGIGMSGIAKILVHKGYKVQGSDLSANQDLIKLGIKVFPRGHNELNLYYNGDINTDIKLVIKSSAIKNDNSELILAKKIGIPVISRGEALVAITKGKFNIGVTGTHGKTTTTAMIWRLLSDKSPTIINGGIINDVDSNAVLGTSDIMITEADESDGSFLLHHNDISVITNIAPEHIDYYGSFDNVIAAYYKFISNTIQYVVSYNEIINRITKLTKLDIPEAKFQNRPNIITYGLTEDANVFAKNVNITSDGIYFDVKFDLPQSKGKLSNVLLPTYGKHNVLNALAAITTSLLIDSKNLEALKSNLSKFKGVKRRFSIISSEFSKITVIDDYAHHPDEILAVLNMTKEWIESKSKTQGRIIVIVQPHRYSRLHLLMSDFIDVLSSDIIDHLIILEVYSAGENNIYNVSSADLVNSVQRTNVRLVSDITCLIDIIQQIAREGDVVLCLGAGDITNIAKTITNHLI